MRHIRVYEAGRPGAKARWGDGTSGEAFLRLDFFWFFFVARQKRTKRKYSDMI